MHASFIQSDDPAVAANQPHIFYAGRACNLFMGPLENADVSGQMGWSARTQEEWEDAWLRAGQAQPAPLPRGAVAHFEQRRRKEHHLDISLPKYWQSQRKLEWHITASPVEENETATGFWVICILPPEMNTHAYSYSQKPSTSERAQAAALAHEKARAHDQNLQQRLAQHAAQNKIRLKL